MINYLATKFIKNKENLQDPVVRSQYGILCMIIDLTVCLLLGMAKMIVGFVIGSIAMVSSAFSDLSDTIINLVTIAGLKIAVRRNSDTHPFGFGRAEYIAGLIVSFIIFGIGLQLVFESVQNILQPEEGIDVSWGPIILLIVDMIGCFYLSILDRKVGKLINSIPLLISSKKSIYDTVTPFAVLIGLVVYAVFGINIDNYIGLGIALMILYSGYTSAMESISPLIGTIPTPEFVQQIREKLLQYPQVKGIHELVIHNYGDNRCFISAHVEFPSTMQKEQVQQIVSDMEQDFTFEKMYLVLHTDYVVMSNPEINEIREIVNAALKMIDPKAYACDFYPLPFNNDVYLSFNIHITRSTLEAHPNIREDISKLARRQNKNQIPIIVIKELFE
ncbi:cation diffusion facilitator family transporter [Parabacteroides sp.]